jgi:hypothetical protein
VRKADIDVSERALRSVSLELDAEHAKTEATQQGYHEKLLVHMAWIKHTLGLDKMVEEKKVLLEEKWDLKIREAALTKAQVCNIHP